jgi:hypothetical protein
MVADIGEHGVVENEKAGNAKYHPRLQGVKLWHSEIQLFILQNKEQIEDKKSHLHKVMIIHIAIEESEYACANRKKDNTNANNQKLQGACLTSDGIDKIQHRDKGEYQAIQQCEQTDTI